MSRFSNIELPPTWRQVPISQVVDIVYGKSLRVQDRDVTGDIPVYGSGGIIGYHDSALHSDPSIVIGRKGTVGSIYYIDTPFWCIDTAFYLKNTHPAINIEFLAYILKVKDLSRLAIMVGVPGINRKEVEKQRIPLPTLPEQREIVKILSQADRLRQLRAEADEKIDLLRASLFDHLFELGNSVQKKWTKTTIGKIGEVSYGLTVNRRRKNLK